MDKKIGKNTLVSLLRLMLRIRMTEEKIAQLYPEQEMRCPTHLYIGQEAVSSGVCQALKKTDYVFSSYRSHGAYIAKGGSIKKLFAELYGKVTGCSKGRGGSMHIIAKDVGRRVVGMRDDNQHIFDVVMAVIIGSGKKF